MRTLMLTLVVVGLLAVPSLGVINVAVTADGPVVDGKVQLQNGATTTIRLLAQGTASGIYSVAGNITATPAPVLLAMNPGSFVWVPEFTSYGPFYSIYGTPGANGGTTDFASQRTDWMTPDPTWGKDSLMQVCSYTITAAPVGIGDVTLSFVAKPVNGIRTMETDKASVMGTFAPVTIHVVPEPTMMALLAIGGAAIFRRRRS